MSDNWKIHYGIPGPKNKQEQDEVATIDGMRRAIFKASYDCQLIRMVDSTAAHIGLSGEDKYAMLAYHALVQLEAAQQMNLRLLDTIPNPDLLIDERAPAKGSDAQ